MKEESIDERLEEYRKMALEIVKEIGKKRESLRQLRGQVSEKEARGILIITAMEIESLFHKMLKLGKSGAKMRGLPTNEIDMLIDELKMKSSEYRESLANSKFERALFKLSEFYLLERKILDCIGSVLAPTPFYEFPLNLQGKLITEASKFLAVDENWIVCVSALMLVEASVNRKLELLGEEPKGDFLKRYEHLVELVKQKENRELLKVLPHLIYQGLRHLAAHSGHKFQPTPDEAKSIVNDVLIVVSEIFGKTK